VAETAAAGTAAGTDAVTAELGSVFVGTPEWPTVFAFDAVDAGFSVTAVSGVAAAAAPVASAGETSLRRFTDVAAAAPVASVGEASGRLLPESMFDLS